MHNIIVRITICFSA